MNRPNELIKELQEFNEILYGDELSTTECKELVNYILCLEKALDKVCEDYANLLIRYLKQNTTKEKIKEYGMEEGEKIYGRS